MSKSSESVKEMPSEYETESEVKNSSRKKSKKKVKEDSETESDVKHKSRKKTKKQVNSDSETDSDVKHKSKKKVKKELKEESETDSDAKPKSRKKSKKEVKEDSETESDAKRKLKKKGKIEVKEGSETDSTSESSSVKRKERKRMKTKKTKKAKKGKKRKRDSSDSSSSDEDEESDSEVESRNARKRRKRNKRKKEKDESDSEYSSDHKEKEQGPTRSKKDKYPMLLTRSAYIKLSVCVGSLGPKQRQAVRDMGFGKLLKFRMTAVPSKLAFYVVDRYEAEEFEIVLPRGRIRIGPNFLNKMLGIPCEGVDLLDRGKVRVKDEKVVKWRRRYPSGEKVTCSMLTNTIKAADDRDNFNFRLDFIMLVLTIMGDCNSQGRSSENLLDYLDSSLELSDINWCGYLLDSMRRCKDNWKSYDGVSAFAGPLAPLLIAYLEHMECDAFRRPTDVSPVEFWNKKHVNAREKYEIKRGGFGLGRVKKSEDLRIEKEEVEDVEDDIDDEANVIEEKVKKSRVTGKKKIDEQGEESGKKDVSPPKNKNKKKTVAKDEEDVPVKKDAESSKRGRRNNQKDDEDVAEKKTADVAKKGRETIQKKDDEVVLKEVEQTPKRGRKKKETVSSKMMELEVMLECAIDYKQSLETKISEMISSHPRNAQLKRIMLKYSAMLTGKPKWEVNNKDVDMQINEVVQSLQGESSKSWNENFVVDDSTVKEKDDEVHQESAEGKIDGVNKQGDEDLVSDHDKVPDVGDSGVIHAGDNVLPEVDVTKTPEKTQIVDKVVGGDKDVALLTKSEDKVFGGDKDEGGDVNTKGDSSGVKPVSDVVVTGQDAPNFSLGLTQDTLDGKNKEDKTEVAGESGVVGSGDGAGKDQGKKGQHVEVGKQDIKEQWAEVVKEFDGKGKKPMESPEQTIRQRQIAILEQARRKPTRTTFPSKALKSPFYQRPVALMSLISKQELHLWDFVMKKEADPSEVIFQSKTGVIITRKDMQTMESDKDVAITVVDGHIAVLNYMERFRSDGSPRRLFCPTSVLVPVLVEKEEVDDRRLQLFIDNFSWALDVNEKYRDLREIDLVFFPMMEDDHYYCVVFDVKNALGTVLDDFKDPMPSCSVEWGDSTPYKVMTMFVNYLRLVKHHNAVALDKV